jgi:tetratricopeptide (TPR) repeat protein
VPEGGKKVRHKPEYLLIAVMSAFAVAAVVGSALDRGVTPTPTVDPIATIEVTPTVTSDAQGWFQSIRAHCNPVEVESQLRRRPAPASHEGHMHEAACYALAGRVDAARSVIAALPQELRYQAAGVVFEAGHPAADAGDEIAAGPLMELVVEFWPNYYMALYHAGAARFESGSYEMAESYLERFLAEYAAQDGWHASAVSMLEAIAAER